MPTIANRGALAAQGYGFGGASKDAVYVEDVFSTYLYSGTGASQTITNGIDLSTKGGMVWIKARNYADGILVDTARGNSSFLQTENSNAPFSAANWFAFTSSGFSPLVLETSSGYNYASWTFRKQAKFFTICTWTGDGTAGRQISHDLGATPGMVIVKSTSAAYNWRVYHKSIGATQFLALNTTDAANTLTGSWNDTSPTSTVFTIGNSPGVNESGQTYVAYLFADSNSGGFGAAGTDSVVACGSYTGNGSASGPTVTLGWEPQFVLVKNSSAANDWQIVDTMRGMSYATGLALAPNLAKTETWEGTNPFIVPTSTGFKVITSSNASFNTSSNTYIYLAIRRGPMKTPTDATKVFAVNTRSGTGAVATVTNAGFPVDLLLPEFRSGSVASRSLYDRLRGKLQLLATYGTAAEVSDVNGVTGFDSMTGYLLGADTNQGSCNYSSTNYVDLAFRRAPGFFDVVCYTGTGSARTIAHNLGVAPELIIAKSRQVGYWPVYHSGILPVDDNGILILNSADGSTGFNGQYVFGNGNVIQQPTASNVYAGSSISDNGVSFILYLFATCPGVSKCGSYTGSGTTKQIDCGFAAGARFVLIKRTDSTGDWYVWDTARGLVSGNDPYLLLNSTAAEVTNTDYIDPYSAGFEISSTAPAAINASGGTFIYLAIA